MLYWENLPTMTALGLAHPGLVFSGVASEYFQAIAFFGALSIGNVFYHRAFNAQG